MFNLLINCKLSVSSYELKKMSDGYETHKRGGTKLNKKIKWFFLSYKSFKCLTCVNYLNLIQVKRN